MAYSEFPPWRAAVCHLFLSSGSKARLSVGSGGMRAPGCSRDAVLPASASCHAALSSLVVWLAPMGSLVSGTLGSPPENTPTNGLSLGESECSRVKSVHGEEEGSAGDQGSLSYAAGYK